MMDFSIICHYENQIHLIYAIYNGNIDIGLVKD
jgi:hypothetical protein